jgi:hypothetical protein
MVRRFYIDLGLVSLVIGVTALWFNSRLGWHSELDFEVLLFVFGVAFLIMGSALLIYGVLAKPLPPQAVIGRR